MNSDLKSAQILSLTRALDEAIHVINGLETVNSHLRYIIALREASASWRLTSPLRTLLPNGIFAKYRPEPTKNPYTINASEIRKCKKRLSILCKRLPLAFWNETALATKYKPGCIFCDVSGILQHNAGTGIQRVVSSLAKELAISGSPNFKLVDMGGLEIVDVSGQFGCNQKQKQVLKPELSSIILMDASWNLIEKIKPFLEAARKAKVRIYAFIYDLFPLTHPELCESNTVRLFTHWFKEIFPLTTDFICISRHTANCLASYASLPPISRVVGSDGKNVHVLHLGSEPHSFDKTQPETTALTGPFFLMVGTVEPRKNYGFAVRELKNLWDKNGIPEKLVIVGRKGWESSEVINLIHEQERDGRVIWLRDGVSDTELRNLYLGAKALIQCSIDEGFGLPIVEAARYGTKLILNDIPVFREIVIQGGNFYDFNNSASFREALLQASRNHERVSEKVKTIQRSWKQCADDLIRLVSGESKKSAGLL